MSMKIQIPDGILDVETGGGSDFVWPATEYVGTIREVRRRNQGDVMIEKGAEDPWVGYATFDVEVFSLELKPLEVLLPTSDSSAGILSIEDIQNKIGDRPFFLGLDPQNGFVIRDGDHNLSNVDWQSKGELYWRLQSSYPKVIQLANALGAIQNGTFDVEDFVDDLVNGSHHLRKVAFKVRHRKVGDKTYAQVARVMPAPK